MPEKIGLEAVLEMSGFNRAAQQYQSTVGKMSNVMQGFGVSAKTAGAITDNLIPIMGGATIAIAGAQKAAEALQKAFEFGKEGAVVAQTQESFDRLMRSMSIGPDILKDMRKAVNGTVDDMTLMSSTMTLLAGTSDELGRAMVDAAPQLLEIAKAANKLNPTLGDTSFLYQSLATGIKRSSPLILDNLGLVVKVGEANERWAEKMGTTVEAMTAEEKQMALLEAALEAGDRMIEQVGGSTDSAVDSFAQLEVAIKNLTDRIKEDASPWIGSFVEVLADTLDIVERLYNPTSDLESAISGMLHPILGLKNAFDELNKSLGTTLDLYDLAVKGGIPLFVGGLEDLIEANKEYSHVTMEMVSKGVEPWIERAREAGEIGVEVATSVEDQAKAQKALEEILRDVTKAYSDFASTLATGMSTWRDLGKEAEASAQEYQQALDDLAKDGTKALQKVQDEFKASLPDPSTVQDRLDSTEDLWDEWGLRIQDIIENGVASPWYAVLQEMGYQKPPDVGIRAWAEDLKAQFYAGQLPDLLPPEWAENVRQQEQEATAAVRQGIADRKKALDDARAAELEAERQARADALFELTLSLAAAQGKLDDWASQQFGPNWSQVIGDVDSLKGYIEQGVIEIDDTLMSLLSNTAAGIGTTLDETAAIADENIRRINDALSEPPPQMAIDEIKQRWFGGVGEMYTYLEEAQPTTPFDSLFDNFDGVAGDIMGRTASMQLGLVDMFGTIDMEWAAAVQSQVLTWSKATEDIQREFREKVVKTIEEEVPRRIVVTIETQVEAGEGGGTDGKQHGGPVQAGVSYVVGESGPELFVPEADGRIIPNWSMNLPDGAVGGGGMVTAGPTVNVSMNPVINTPMDLAEFQMMTERTVRRAIRGYD